MKCTNCGIETSLVYDLHCQREFKDIITNLIEKNEIGRAYSKFKSFRFKNEHTEAWKRDEFPEFSKKYDLELLSCVKNQQSLNDLDLKRLKCLQSLSQIKEKLKNETEKEEEYLTSISQKTIEEQVLSEEEIKFMNTINYHDLLGNYYYNLYLKSHNFWDLSKASSNYRKHGDYNKAIEITDGLEDAQGREDLSAVLTSRGGAFKDLKEWSRAEQCAYKALDKAISFYPYTLLGAVNILKGNLSQAEFFFDKAIKLGAPNKSISSEISNTIKKLSEEKQEELKDFFLQKYK